MGIDSKLEFWRVSNGFPGKTQADAEEFEGDGWDGMGVPDSQNLTGDPYFTDGYRAFAVLAEPRADLRVTDLD